MRGGIKQIKTNTIWWFEIKALSLQLVFHREKLLDDVRATAVALYFFVYL